MMEEGPGAELGHFLDPPLHDDGGHNGATVRGADGHLFCLEVRESEMLYHLRAPRLPIMRSTGLAWWLLQCAAEVIGYQETLNVEKRRLLTSIYRALKVVNDEERCFLSFKIAGAIVDGERLVRPDRNQAACVRPRGCGRVAQCGARGCGPL
jgi:hypothetical protein